MRYQHKWEDVPLSDVPEENQRNLEATIHRSVELGINHIETARGYGSSERQLGLVLPSFKRDELIVQTKIFPTADPAEFVKNFHESLERLQLDHVDLLGIHGINNHKRMWDTVAPGGCLAAARQLVKEGKVRHVGFSSHGSRKLIRQCIAHEEDGGFDYVNLHWYYIDQYNGEAIADAGKKDMGVFIISPNDKGGMLYKPSDKLAKLCEPLHPIVFNALFCLANAGVHTMSLGASCPEDFELQLAALETPEGKTTAQSAAKVIGPIVERLDGAIAAAVGKDVMEGYREGLPSWEDTPGHINLKIVLRLRQLVLGLDMLEYGRMRYNLLGNGGHWFPGLNAQFAGELDFEKALGDSPFGKQIPGWLVEAHELMGAEAVERLSQS